MGPLERLMAQRGIGDIAEFVRPKLSTLPDPSAMAGFDKGVARVVDAIKHKHDVYLYGDFDADGVTSTAILYRTLLSLGVTPDVQVASRQKGYGYNFDATKEYTNNSVIVILDCGTNDFAGVHTASMYADVIVIDHHKISIPEFPGYALINPQQDGKFPKTLCTAGLSFCFSAAIAKKVDPSLDMRRFTDLVAVGSIADMVQIDNTNRELIRAGLREINDFANYDRPGVSSMLKVAKHRGQITSTTLGWTLAPRLNACGRLGDARPALDVLLQDDEYHALMAAAKIEKSNKQRRSLQQDYLDEAERNIKLEEINNDRCIVVSNKLWLPGLVGVVAGRLLDKYTVPVIVLGGVEGEDLYRGSGRSPDGISLYDALRSTERTLKNDGDTNPIVRFGGHAGAAGITMYQWGIERFIRAFKEYCSEHCPEAPGVRVPEPELHLDISDVTLELSNGLIACGPYGRGFPVPVFEVGPFKVENTRLFKDDQHLEVTSGDVRCLWFGCPEDFRPLPDESIRVIGHIETGHDWKTGEPYPMIKVVHAVQEVC